MLFKNILFIICVVNIPSSLLAQKELTSFPELIMSNIPGAPKLTKPILISGDINEIMGEGHGLAAPAYYDINEDGLKDLLIGEFGSGILEGRYMGNFVRVYKNTGTENYPLFNTIWDYARPPFQYQVEAHGTPYSVDQFCCMGFTPQFVDLNNDGSIDMVTGSYQGEVYWFRGTKAGFLPGSPLSQAGNPRDSDDKVFSKNQTYWTYSSASFGDFTGDGLLDLIIGGNSLRISKNIGDTNIPRFGIRELLLDVDGNPLKVYDYKPDELQQKQELEKTSNGIIPVPASGADHLAPYVTDWDNDGVLDLLVANSYAHKGLAVADFFKGVKKNGQYRFKKAIRLFTARNGVKEFPGSDPRLYVSDWNNDGINDLLIGSSVVIVNNMFSEEFSWNWEKDMDLHGAGKDPANLKTLPKEMLLSYQKELRLPEGMNIDDYMTLHHRGYVFVMLGKRQ